MSELAPRLLQWYERHGRKGLPWQRERSAYRVWVSEIMLQQTQVQTVLPYFERFMKRFPDIGALADATTDEVLAHWSGLGYYARARNLHKTARIIAAEHEGVFPRTFDAIHALPGIGRSTAGAILAQAWDQPHPILDGNAKRVLARHYAVAGWPGHSAVSKRLWELAEAATPAKRAADYTQAIMDLGATLCTRSRPACGECPLHSTCMAARDGAVERYPGKRPRKPLPVRATRFLLATDGQGRILLQRRPPAGIWGGLWVPPECPRDLEPAQWLADAFGVKAETGASWPVLRHTFSHFHLDIEPIRLQVNGIRCAIMEANDAVWYKPELSNQLGLPAPVARLIGQLANDQPGS